MDAALRTLVVAPTPALAGDVMHVLMRAGVTIGARRLETLDDLRAALVEPAEEWELVVCAPGGEIDAAATIELVRGADREVPVVLIDADADSDVATGVLAVTREQPGSDVAQAVRRELALARTRREARTASHALDLREHALATATTGIVIADAGQEGFPTVYVNPAFEGLTGWPAHAVLGQSCALLQGEGTDPAAIAELRAALREGRAAQVRLLNYRRDGSTFWNELSLSPLRDADGRVTHVVGVLDDVTERVEALDRLDAVQRDNASLIEDLAEAEQRYRQLVERIPMVTYVADFDEVGTLRYVSPQIEDLLGHPADAFLEDQDLWFALIHPDDRERVREETVRSFQEQRGFDCEFRMVGADGRELHLWERDAIVVDDDGRPVLTQGVLVDITPLRRTEIALREERDRAQLYLDVAGTMIVVLDPTGSVELVNRTGHEVLGYREGELQGRDWFELCIPEADRHASQRVFRRLMAGQLEASTETYESGVVTRDGQLRMISWHNTVLRDEDGAITAALSSGVDITERRRAEEQIAYLAYHDSLTGLPNRSLLHEHLELALARARRTGRSVALMYLDLDDFKLVNDSFGHEAGDELLRSVAARLDTRRRTTDLLARQGGDEFLLLISDVEHDPVRVAEAAAEGMLSVLSDPFGIAGEQFHLAASVGISVYPRDAQDADTLLRHADAAMYQAKAAGRSGVKSYEGRGGAPLERLSMTTRLRRAVAQDEFVLHWQPIVAPQTRALHALEALIRWEDPVRGPLSPIDFIPVAEETGLIERVGEWVAEAICRQRLLWLADGVDPVVTLNVSARELRRGDLAERLLERQERHGLDPSRLIVEITETAAMRDHARTEPLLARLVEGGMRVAVDDFGAGYSSLSRLRALPVHMLKLDRSFLADVPERPEAAAMVAAVLELAAALGMDAVVEGVETDAQREFLVARGCPLAQGYLLGRPVPAHELGGVLRPPRTTAARVTPA
jgi:diguanylate cyclase (GGDEF)-like protein/PAS domain S-box-containing protein